MAFSYHLFFFNGTGENDVTVRFGKCIDGIDYYEDDDQEQNENTDENHSTETEHSLGKQNSLTYYYFLLYSDLEKKPTKHFYTFIFCLLVCHNARLSVRLLLFFALFFIGSFL